jgi:NAD(P)-dependent dehydrogenase (short-subunit alcohol dehydrogenase family)
MSADGKQRILLIGGSGGIAEALASQLLQPTSENEVHIVSRSQPPETTTSAPTCCVPVWYKINSLDETQVKSLVEQWKNADIRFDRVISTVGILHGEGIKPEKRLEDIDIQSMQQVFHVNTLANAQWLKYAPQIVNRTRSAWVVLSARVGSISDNRLGGWYAYRASKAALNMLIKTASVEFKRRLPNTVLVAYHPGTVDTQLSKPFQANVKPGKLFTAQFTAEQLLSLLENLSVDQNPHYLDWQGKTIPW